MTPSTEKPDRDGLTHILLVEDNPDHAELVMRSFDSRRSEIDLHHVTDGAMALGYLRGEGRYADREAFPAPRLVLLDLRLPKVDGIGVLQAMKSDPKLHRIPVIMLTTSTSEADMRRAYSNHVNSYLKKPLDFPEFHRMMQSFTDYWLAWNQSPV
jgi:CheY-like chemotaxis protein